MKDRGKLINEAWDQFDAQVRVLCANYEQVHILEFGGGRSPMFNLEDLPPNVASYTVNDIDPNELALVDKRYQTACFDVCGNVGKFAGKYNIVISKMLAEHVPDGRRMHENTLTLLEPGGVAFHFFPKLYASPFVVNLFLPEKLSRRLLFALFPKRRSEVPKFPALYSWCRGTAAGIQARIAGLGYTNVTVVPFYGHGYYDRVPLLKQLERLTRAIARRFGLSGLATYVWLIAQR